jgi:tripartite-type tricarboxylate transporter receptor subunit TctC
MFDRLLQLGAVAVGLGAASSLAWAQEYPSRPITMIVGYAVGGPTDTLARIIAEGMGKSLGERIVIENVTGASGSIGVGRVARAASDGYTISLGDWSTHVANGAVYTLSYDVFNDLRPVARLPSNPMLLLARNAIPAGNVEGLIAWVKANSGNVSIGTSGAGSPPHIAAAYFQSVTGAHLQMLPYRGAAPTLLDMIAGRVDLSVMQASFALPHVREGKVRAYAVTAPTRWAAAPEIPTVDEAGLPGFHMSVWRGIWAPSHTPESVIAKLASAVTDTLADQSVRERLAQMGEDIPAREQQGPGALETLQRAEVERWWPLIKALGINAEGRQTFN